LAEIYTLRALFSYRYTSGNKRLTLI